MRDFSVRLGVGSVVLLLAQAGYAQPVPSGRPVTGTAAAPPPSPGAPRPAAASDLAVPVHGQYTLTLPASPSRIAIGDPDVADIKVLPPGRNRTAQMLVLGKKAGSTQLQVWTAGNAEPQIWTVRVAGDVQQALNSRGLGGGMQLDVAGSAAIITGQAANAEEHRTTVEAARDAVGKGNVVDASTIATSSVVQVEVKIVELSRTAMKQVGMNATFSSGPWNVGTNFIQTAGEGITSNGFSLAYNISHFGTTLQLLESNGLARVLAEPTLLAQSGQSASFLAGGEIPVPESGGLGTQNVVYKPFGVGLSVTPTVLGHGRIALKVAPEASELDPTNGIPIVNGDNTTVIPALRTRKADTTVELGDGETFIISGLVSRQTKAAVSKVPFLGDLPIIGAFFRGIQYSQEDRELVIVVTPRLVKPIARGVSLPLPGGREEVENRDSTAWGYYLLGPAGGQQMPGFSR
jgi:pilus assembly protein CpaC